MDHAYVKFESKVIEYIQFLQEKVQKYEGPYVGWNQEPAKLMPWDLEAPSSNQGTARSRVGSGEDPDHAPKKLKTHKS
ncbi:hypothetical protein Q3G72_017499 [Acer saccharum]|nr:hypothetical protein Q3G72_017499 [Acer saccharum]